MFLSNLIYASFSSALDICEHIDFIWHVLQHNEEAKIAKEVEAHEKRIRKELEKQDILRRKVSACFQLMDIISIYYLA